MKMLIPLYPSCALADSLQVRLLPRRKMSRVKMRSLKKLIKTLQIKPGKEIPYANTGIKDTVLKVMNVLGSIHMKTVKNI